MLCVGLIRRFWSDPPPLHAVRRVSPLRNQPPCVQVPLQTVSIRNGYGTHRRDGKAEDWPGGVAPSRFLALSALAPLLGVAPAPKRGRNGARHERRSFLK